MSSRISASYQLPGTPSDSVLFCFIIHSHVHSHETEIHSKSSSVNDSAPESQPSASSLLLHLPPDHLPMKIPAASDRRMIFCFLLRRCLSRPVNASSASKTRIASPESCSASSRARRTELARYALFAAGRGFSCRLALPLSMNLQVMSPHIWHRPQNDIPAKSQSSPARSNPDTRPGKGGWHISHFRPVLQPSKDSAPAHCARRLNRSKSSLSVLFFQNCALHRHRIFLIPHYIKERQSPHP